MTLLNKTCFFAIILFLNIFLGCSDNATQNEENGPVSKESISGVVQKGPFSSGGNITLYELQHENLSQTGRSFNSQISNNEGLFEFNNIELENPVTHLRANGFYFNEIKGKQSDSPITLQALAHLSADSSFNVNVLSHLSKPRIEYLVESGMDFKSAREQADTEVLNIFGIASATESGTTAGKMNITSEGVENFVLLTVSSILQGYRKEAELSELLSFISDDLREDGTLDDASLGSQLINHARYLQPEVIRQNLIDRYADLGVDINIPDFSLYISEFVENAPYEVTEELIDYPSEGRYGTNVLHQDRTQIKTYPDNTYFNSLHAELTEGTALKIRITTLEGTPHATEGMWFYGAFSGINLEIKPYDYSSHIQEFVAVESGKEMDLQIHFDPGKFLIEYYEMDTDAAEPTWSKEVKVSY